MYPARALFPDPLKFISERWPFKAEIMECKGFTLAIILMPGWFKIWIGKWELNIWTRRYYESLELTFGGGL